MIPSEDAPANPANTSTLPQAPPSQPSEATRSWRWIIAPVFAVALAADLLSKAWALDALAPSPWLRVVVIPGFLDFRIAYNTGGAFSMLDGNVWVVTTISLVCMAFVVAWARTIPPRHFWPQLAMGLVAGGAIGNLHDRIRWQYVVDFIHAHVVLDGTEYAWPTFNIADSCIVVGIAILLSLGLFSSQLEDPTPVPRQQGADSGSADGIPPHQERSS